MHSKTEWRQTCYFLAGAAALLEKKKKKKKIYVKYIILKLDVKAKYSATWHGNKFFW